MRLSANYNRVNILTSLVMLLITGVIYYLFIHSILTDKLDKDLEVEEDEIRQYTATYHRLPLPASFIDQQISYKEITPATSRREFEYTTYFNPKEKEEEPGRSLFTWVKLGNKTFEVTITKSRVESEDLVRVILIITTAITILLLLILVIINRFLLNRLWRPFYTTLNGMKAFEVTSTEKIKEEPTEIDEFIELSASVNTMADKVRKDYRELKSFTDNASHEMMTPLAVINSKLDSLIQTEDFTDEQGLLLQDIYQATGRLSRLHQSLLLLAKIENKLIPDVQTINLQELLSAKLRQFHELFEKDSLKVDSSLHPVNIMMSKFLADILLNNLISNAIRHNEKGGCIQIMLTDQTLTVANTGEKIPLQINLFERFSKSAQSEGMGLGLAITKQICSLYQFELAYTYTGDMHFFSINFNTP
ncbi:HAMP domain-containing sensor histidine kinase [Pedobacter aquatilis]|uniref:sensor histidine kinase n=1 Tax=Pedobacter aquatilis TaxID=351343 RepID=UPI002930CC9B|nr:HAMP domain-containing sensor histidine kinase [Pedobacter aquatilis]